MGFVAKDVHYEDAERTSIELVTIVDFKSFIDLDDRGQDGKPGHRGTRFVSMIID